MTVMGMPLGKASLANSCGAFAALESRLRPLALPGIFLGACHNSQRMWAYTGGLSLLPRSPLLTWQQTLEVTALPTGQRPAPPALRSAAMVEVMMKRMLTWTRMPCWKNSWTRTWISTGPCLPPFYSTPSSCASPRGPAAAVESGLTRGSNAVHNSLGVWQQKAFSLP